MTDTPEIPSPPDGPPPSPAPGVPAAPVATPPRKSRWWLRTFAVLLLIAIGITGGLAYDAWRFLRTPASATPQDVIISIAPGATFDRVAYDLKKAGAITDVPRFRLLGQYRDSLGKIKAGEFLVNTGWTPEQVLLQLTNGQALLYRLSIREGLTWWETARAVEAQGFATFEDFKAVIHDPAFLRAHDIPFANAEGFLFPETYMLRKPKALDRAQAEAVASIMIRMFWKKTAPLWQNLPPREGVVLAAPEPPVQAGVPMAATQVSANGTTGTGNTTTGTSPVAANATHLSAPSGAAAPLASPAAGSTATAQSVPAQATGGSNGTASRNTLPPQENATTAATGTGEDPARPRGNPGSSAPFPGPGARPLLTSPAQIAPDALKRLIIMASLVEKETAIPAERAQVAGVYANRLRDRILLQCDPTIIYGVGESFSGSIRRSQLNDATNKYNTYQHAGLPPGPICSSGFAALEAAMFPARHDLYYFVATGVDGGHTFSRTLDEHNKAVEVYRRATR